jgi:hypothetical protein
LIAQNLVKNQSSTLLLVFLVGLYKEQTQDVRINFVGLESVVPPLVEMASSLAGWVVTLNVQNSSKNQFSALLLVVLTGLNKKKTNDVRIDCAAGRRHWLDE